MLRASVEATGQPVDLRSIGDFTVDPLLPAGTALRALADAVVLRDKFERDVAIEALAAAAGEHGAVRAAAVIANFEMMNRLVDGIGLPPGDADAELAPELCVQWPRPEK